MNMARKRVEISKSREQSADFVQMMVDKANTPDLKATPYDGAVEDADKIENLTKELKNKFADKKK